MSSNSFWNLVEKYKRPDLLKSLGLDEDTPGITSTRGTTTETDTFWNKVEEYQSDSISEMYSQLAPYSTVKIDDDIAPVKEEDEGGLDFFQKSKVFDDGYDFGDVTKTILGTAGDAGLGLVKGFTKTVEGVSDLIGYGMAGVADKLGAEGFARGVKEAAKEDTWENWLKPASDYLDKASILGRTSDAITEGIGQVGTVVATGGLGAAAGLGTVGTTALTTGLMGVSGMGSGMGEAYKGGATDEEALTYGAIAGTADALTELIFGGLGKAVKATGLSVGLSSADDMLAKKVSSLFTSQIAKNFAEFGIKAGAEGFEEVLAGLAQGIGKKLTYMDEEELSTILKDENLLEQFVVGAVTSGLYQSGGIPGTREGSLIEANKTGKDFITGLTQNEQMVIDKEYENRLAEKEKDVKLTNKQKNDLYNRVIEDMDKGYISTDTIEEVLGGETYQSYQDTVKSEDSLIEQEKTLTDEYNTLNKMVNEKMTGEQQVRRDELRGMLPELRQKITDQKNTSQRDQLKTKLSEEVMGLAQGSRLMESYNEVGRRKQAFEADLSQYDTKQQEVIKKAVESGILNNTNRTHEFVDFIAKVSADKGVLFDFTNNAKLKESGFALNGRSINGYVTKDGVTVNIQSAKSLNSVVGHEITHVLEGTDLYAELQSAVVEYAKTKGEYQSRYDALTKLYEGVEGANIDAELTADLVGDYLFTDSDFISKLSTQNRNVFQKIFDEVKYLLKVATAGSKEAQQLEKVKRAFEEAYRETAKAPTETKYSIGDKNIDISVDDYHSGEMFATMSYKQDGKIVGTLTYSEYEGTPSIKMVEVIPEYRRRGIGTKLLQELQNQYPDAEIDFGMATDDGMKLLESATYTVENTELAAKFKRLDEVTSKLAEYDANYERFFNDEIDLPEDYAPDYEDLQFEESKLRQELWKKKKTKTLVKTDSDVKYSLSDNAETRFSQAEIYTIQNIGRKSVNNFNSQDIAATEKFAQRYWSEMGTKSPFYRAWFGDWRANDAAPVTIATKQGDTRVNHVNKDTGWSIRNSSQVHSETKALNSLIHREAVPYLPYIDEIIENAVLLDTEGVGKRKSANSLLMHYMYAVADIGNGQEVLKLTVEEMYNPGEKNTNHRAYVLQNIEKAFVVRGRGQGNTPSSGTNTTNAVKTVADLFALVKSMDSNFVPNESSKIVNADGTPKAMYHGSPEQFTQFDRSKAKSSGLYGKGFYFTDSESHAGTYGNLYKVYLNIKNPLQSGGVSVTRDQVRSYLEAVAENEDYSIENYGTYDIDAILDIVVGKGSSVDAFKVIQDINTTAIGDMVEAAELFNSVNRTKFDGIVVATETVAFYPEQIKSATDNVGTFDKNNPDIQLSLAEEGAQNQAYGNYNVYGKDVALETEEVAPVAENAALVAENDTIAAEDTVEDLFPDDTAALQEEYEQLVAERDDILGAMGIFEAVGDTSNAEKMMADLETVETRIAEIEADESDRLASISEADEPVTMDSTPEDVADNVPLTKTMVAELAKDIRSRLALPAKRVAEVRDLIARYSAEEFPSRAHLYAEIYDRFGTFTESYVDEDLKGVKSLLRTYGIAVDDSIKRDIADYGQLMRSNFGKVRFSKEGLPVDVAYMEFQEVMPGLFPESIDVPSDQLLRIIEVANMDTTVAQEQNIDSDTLVEVTDLIANSVAQFKQVRKETLANKHGRESFQSLMEDADQYVPPVKLNTSAPTRTEMAANSDDIAPVFDTTSGQQAFMPEMETEAPKRLTRKELHENIVDDITTTFREQGYEFTDVLKNAKDLSTFATVDNTPQRVMEKALGYKEGQILADMTVNKVAQNETEGIKWLNSFTDKKDGLLAKISKQYNIKPGSKQSAAAQMYAEGFYVGENDAIIAYGDAELAKDFPDAQVQANIKKLARDPRIRMIYDETLAAINDSRTRNAYPEIPRLDNYFLHFRAMEDTFSRLGLPFNPNDIRAKDLPTDLNGVTADLKPGQPYFASAMHRKGKRTSFDLLGGLEKYLTSAKNQIYHIDDIQTLRALRNYVAQTYGQAHGLENLDTMSDEEAEQRIEEVYNSHLSTFAKFLNEEANVLAGKTSLIDRGLEGVIGRRGMTFLDTLNRQVGANMVGFNVSSSLTNLIAPVQAFAKTNKFDFVKALAQTASNKIASIAGKGDNFVEESPVMIRRKGAERFYRTPYQKVADTGYVFMSMVDDLSTELIARTKYNELIRKGMYSQQAHIETDKWVSRLMGDRSLGQQPQLYNSKTLGLITKFQLEVRNQLDSQFYDTIQEAKVSSEQIENKLLRNAKTAAKVTSTFAQLAVLQHLFGKAFESVAGYNPAFDIIEALIKTMGWDDDEEDEDTVLDNIEQGFLELLGDLPYTSTLTGGRIPIASALPVTELIKGEDQYGNEKSRWDTLKEAAPYYFLPGGYGQIKKTKAGLEMFSEEHPVTGSYTDSGKLRFPVEDTLGNRVQAGLFGQWASENARDYFNNERKPMQENQIEEFLASGMEIGDYWDYREGLSEYDTLEEKADYIAGLDLPLGTKNLLVNNLTDRKESIDLADYDEYGGLEEMDFATKNPEKYEVAVAVGGYKNYMKYQEDMKGMKLAEKADYIAGLNLTTQQKNLLINSETDRKEPIDLEGYENYSSFEEFEYAKKNPEKYALAKAVGGYDSYTVYSDILGDIKSDKDEWGESISGSRKPKVYSYIYSLDIPEIEQHILFKNEYPSTDDHNMEIIDYLNNRDDISYDEMVAILLELDFKVSADGIIRW